MDTLKEENILDEPPLLPRSGWQNRQAWLKVLIRVKRSLDIAEINTWLN